jgi:hypothetical protein
MGPRPLSLIFREGIFFMFDFGDFIGGAIPVLGGYFQAREERKSATAASRALEGQTASNAQIAAAAALQRPLNIKTYVVLGIAALFAAGLAFKFVRT